MTGISNIKAGLRAVIAIAVCASALVLPAQALAQTECANAGSDPTAAQYCSVNGVQTENGSGPNKAADNSPASETAPVSTSNNSGTEAVSTSTSGSDSLPFTGLDVGILLLVAVLLTGTGLALRRLTASGAHRS